MGLETLAGSGQRREEKMDGHSLEMAVFMRAGIRFSYCRAAMFPQIPHVQDVLFVLQLSPKKDERDYYSPASANWPEYIMNLMLVAATVAPKVLVSVDDYDEAEARKIIARAIMDLCPDEAKCLFDAAYAEAKKIAGEEVLPEGTSREALLAACNCPECVRTIREEQRSLERFGHCGDEPEGPFDSYE